MVDINGYKKGPNMVGKDLFHFTIQPNYKVSSYGLGATSSPNNSFGNTIPERSVLKTGNYGCNKTGLGYWCTALIMTDTWQIKDDYPW